ncbi:hypothetical protein [Cohnella cellulosilytica]|uniref:Uncharacterized protein n=1 Tax=Cohnella cellulosilytica TaxID=986710 RepID=A0ABW2FNX3_9BACL
MGKRKSLSIWPVLAVLLFAMLPPLHAEANMLDRIRDIYKAPDKVDELREQYEETARTLEEQRQKLMETESSLAEQGQKLTEAESSLEAYSAEQERMRQENELYRQQNEELRTQNGLLTERLEQLEKDKADKQAMYRKWITMIGTAVALIVGYVLSIRLWRYSEWRRRKRLRGGMRNAG